MILIINDVIYRKISNVKTVNDLVGLHQRIVISILIFFFDDQYLSPTVSGGQSEGVTNYVLKTTTESSDDEFDFDKKTKSAKRRKTTTQSTTVITRAARHRATIPISQLVEDTECTFHGNTPDPENCQCRICN